MSNKCCGTFSEDVYGFTRISVAKCTGFSTTDLNPLVLLNLTTATTTPYDSVGAVATNTRLRESNTRSRNIFPKILEPAVRFRFPNFRWSR